MNIDILKKLIKLANHNSNDHEANSAARRVCKMLGEAIDSGKLNFNSIKKETKPPVSKQETNYRDTRYDYAYYDEVKNVNDNFWKMIQDILKKDKEKYKNYSEGNWDNFDRTKEPEFKSYNPYDIYDIPFTKSKKKKEKRILNCTKCKQDKETKFVGHQAVFICADCNWTDFHENRK